MCKTVFTGRVIHLILQHLNFCNWPQEQFLHQGTIHLLRMIYRKLFSWHGDKCTVALAWFLGSEWVVCLSVSCACSEICTMINTECRVDCCICTIFVNNESAVRKKIQIIANSPLMMFNASTKCLFSCSVQLLKTEEIAQMLYLIGLFKVQDVTTLTQSC